MQVKSDFMIIHYNINAQNRLWEEAYLRSRLKSSGGEVGESLSAGSDGENKPQAKLRGSIIEHLNSSLHEVNK